MVGLQGESESGMKLYGVDVVEPHVVLHFGVLWYDVVVVHPANEFKMLQLNAFKIVTHSQLV